MPSKFSLTLLVAAVPNVLSFVPSALHYRQAPLGSLRHQLEFPEDLHGISSQELREMSEARRRRLEEEKAVKSRFITGDALHQLREEVMLLSEELNTARYEGREERVHELEQAIFQAQQVDAEYVYQAASQRAEEATTPEEKASHHREALQARNSLPQFNMQGLWVGKYGDRGFEMINVTYVGDVLIAYKVTGKKTVPMGEVSFSVDLSAPVDEDLLEPIELSDDAAGQWGSKYLQRFSGKGQVSSRGFYRPQWVEGQLILVNQYFSFSWMPSGHQVHQVFFGRPSPELTLKLLRQSRSQQNDTRQHLSRCLEETDFIEDDMETDDSIFRSHDQGYYYDQEGCFD